MTMMTKTKEQVIAERQEFIRTTMLREAHNEVVMRLISEADFEGRATITRWYLFGQVALYDNGSLLYDDDNWGEIKKEISIPSSFWMSMLLKSRAISDLGSIITQYSYQFPLTDLGRDNDNPTISTATWWNNSIRNVRRIQVLSWLGIIGGTV